MNSGKSIKRVISLLLAIVFISTNTVYPQEVNTANTLRVPIDKNVIIRMGETKTFLTRDGVNPYTPEELAGLLDKPKKTVNIHRLAVSLTGPDQEIRESAGKVLEQLSDKVKQTVNNIVRGIKEEYVEASEFLKWDSEAKGAVAVYDMIQAATEKGLTQEDLLKIIDEKDFLITSIRVSMCLEMMRSGIVKDRALEIAKGVTRSILSGKQCELMAAADLVKGTNDLAIGGALGGTSFIFELTDKDGKLTPVGNGQEKTFKSLSGGRDAKELSVDELTDLLVKGIIEAAESKKEVLFKQKTIKIGISLPGQTENSEGGWGKTIFESPNLPFKGNVNLTDLIEAKVRNKIGLSIGVEVYLKNDGPASLDGERSALGTFGKNKWGSGFRIILGTGIGGAGFEDGRSSNDRALVEFGHTIVTRREGFSPLRDSFQYIGAQCKEKRGFFTDDQLAGQSLGDFERLAGGEHLYYLAINMFNLTTKGEGHHKDLPEATEAGIKDNADALQLIQFYGITVGKAIAAIVIGSNSDRKWQEHIVLGSTVGEKFAAGVFVPKVILTQLHEFQTLEEKTNISSVAVNKAL